VLDGRKIHIGFVRDSAGMGKKSHRPIAKKKKKGGVGLDEKYIIRTERGSFWKVRPGGEGQALKIGGDSGGAFSI